MDLVPLPESEGLEHFQGSILDITDLSSAMRDCDVIVHLAALLGVENSEKRRLACLNINIQGTIMVLEACAKERSKKFIYASSSEVYGEGDGSPIHEDTPLNPKSIYAISKLAGEEYVKTYAERYAMEYTILRFFNAYGRHQVGQFVIPRFINAVLNDSSPLLIGDGSQVRSFCYGADIADGIILSLFSDRANQTTLNLGNDQEPVTMRELAEKIISISGKHHLKPRIAKKSESDRTPQRDIQSRIPSIERARTLLGYQPKISLDVGIKKLIESGTIEDSWRGRAE